MLIGFTGPIGCGKTTSAHICTGNVLSFAKPLKEAAAVLFGFTHEQLYTLDGKNAVDPYWGFSPREALQILGTQCIRAHFPGLWEKRMEKSISQLPDSAVVAIDDVRFQAEADLVRRMGGVVVHIVGRMASPAGISGHESEQALDICYGDEVIDNIGNIVDLERTLQRLLDYFGVNEAIGL